MVKFNRLPFIASTLSFFGVLLIVVRQASAQSTIPDPGKDIASFFDFFTWLISRSFIPFLFAIAFLFFVYGVVILVVYPNSEEQKRKGGQYMIWGILGIAVMTAVWGLVGIVTGTLFGGSVLPTLPEG